MKKLSYAFLLVALFSTLAYALLDVDRQEIKNRNFHTNGGFENGIFGTTATNAGAVVETTNVRSGRRALRCLATAINGYCELKLVTVPGVTSTAEAKVFYKTAVSSWKMDILDSTNSVVATMNPMTSAADFASATVGYPMTSGTAYKIRFTDTAAAGWTALYVDDVFQGISEAGVSSDSLYIGTGAAGDKNIYANNADANKPAIRYDDTANAWQLANDGTTFAAISTGGGGGGGSLSFDALAGEALTGATSPVAVYAKTEPTLIVTASNQHIEISEDGGGAVIVAITNGNYFRKNLNGNVATYGLDQVIEDALNASALTGTYTVECLKADNLCTITAVGPTTISILWKTGTHGADGTDTHIGTLLGFSDAANSTGALTYTGASAAAFVVKNTVLLSDTDQIMSSPSSGFVSTTVAQGAAVTVTTGGTITGFSGLTEGKKMVTNATAGTITAQENSVAGSFEVGYALSTSSIYTWLERYLVTYFGSWLTTPTEKDYGAEIVNGDTHCNDNGRCVRIVIYSPASSAEYRYQYSNNGGVTWSDSVSAYAISSNPAENYNGNYYLKPRIIIDENGYGVAALAIYSVATSTWHVHESHSSDYGATWSSPVYLVGGAGADNFPADVACRENKCVILVNRSSNLVSTLFISDNTGSGYASWSGAVGLTIDYYYDRPSFVGIQYFPSESGINQHRIVTAGLSQSGFDLSYSAFKGDGSGEVSGKIYTGGLSDYPIASGMDAASPGNRIVFLLAFTGASATLRQVESNDTYNGGVITWNTHSSHDINSGGSGIDKYNGYSGASDIRLIWNSNNRMVVYGNYAYGIVQTNANPSSAPAATMFSTANLTGGTWTRSNVGLTTHKVQEASLCYVPASNSLALVYKYNSDTLENNLTNGQIWSRLGEVNLSTGAVSWGDHTQIDGGKAMAGFAGFTQAVCSNDKVTVSWEQDIGARDVLKGSVNY